MIGAIVGDIIGSRFEHAQIKSKDFDLFSHDSRFTDDTVLTIAIADCLANNMNYSEGLKKWGRLYPWAGYGATFTKWLAGLIQEPYNSWGNGSAMRVGPVAYAFGTLEDVLTEARHTAEITHNHPEGVKGAQAIASAAFLARSGYSKPAIKSYIVDHFHYDLETPLDVIRVDYSFDVSCQGSVPQAIRAFLESTDFEDAIRNAVSLGGDADTLACMSGTMAEAYYGVPEWMAEEVVSRLDTRMLHVIEAFDSSFSKS